MSCVVLIFRTNGKTHCKYLFEYRFLPLSFVSSVDLISMLSLSSFKSLYEISNINKNILKTYLFIISVIILMYIITLNVNISDYLHIFSVLPD